MASPSRVAGSWAIAEMGDIARFATPASPRAGWEVLSAIEQQGAATPRAHQHSWQPPRRGAILSASNPSSTRRGVSTDRWPVLP